MTKNENLYDISEKIKTKQDFEIFLHLYYQDFLKNQAEWENNNLESFLEALSAYGKDIDGYYKNFNIKQNMEEPTWKVFADILLGAKVYE